MAMAFEIGSLKIQIFKSSKIKRYDK